jgi:hypothetical protein
VLLRYGVYVVFLEDGRTKVYEGLHHCLDVHRNEERELQILHAMWLQVSSHVIELHEVLLVEAHEGGSQDLYVEVGVSYHRRT